MGVVIVALVVALGVIHIIREEMGSDHGRWDTVEDVEAASQDGSQTSRGCARVYREDQ